MDAVNYITVVINRIKLLFAIVLLSFVCSGLYAQKRSREVPPLRDRIFFGGNFALQIGSVTNIEISPLIGLWVLPNLAVAAGPSYSFYKYDNVQTDIFGARAYTQLILLRDLDKFIPLGIHTSIFIQLEDEMLSLESDKWTTNPVTSNRINVNTLLAGGGISQQIGQRSAINLMVLWTLTDSGYQIYSNPEFRVGFVF